MNAANAAQVRCTHTPMLFLSFTLSLSLTLMKLTFNYNFVFFLFFFFIFFIFIFKRKIIYQIGYSLIDRYKENVFAECSFEMQLKVKNVRNVTFFKNYIYTGKKKKEMLGV